MSEFKKAYLYISNYSYNRLSFSYCNIDYKFLLVDAIVDSILICVQFNHFSY